MSSKFDDFLQEQLQDLEVRKEYEALQPEHRVIQARIDAEKKSGMLPKESQALKCLYPSENSRKFCPTYPVMETGNYGMMDTVIPEIQNR